MDNDGDASWEQVQYPGFVYVLQLEQGKYYVGYTTRDNAQRIQEHYNATSVSASVSSPAPAAAWTTKYKPVQLIRWLPAIPEDEDRITLELMREHGWWQVRGGRWSDPSLSGPPTEIWNSGTLSTLAKVVVTMSNLFSTLTLPRPKERFATGCYRCGRNTHWVKDCYAKRDIHGRLL